MIFAVSGKQTIIISHEDGTRETREVWAKFLFRVTGHRDPTTHPSIVEHAVRYRTTRLARRLGFTNPRARTIKYLANDEVNPLTLLSA